jgi:BMFP domain-containing protein YqiC
MINHNFKKSVIQKRRSTLKVIIYRLDVVQREGREMVKMIPNFTL